jgi:hypothetical protein
LGLLLRPPSDDTGPLQLGHDLRNKLALLLELGDYAPSRVLPHTGDLGHRLAERVSQASDLVLNLNEALRRRRSRLR